MRTRPRTGVIRHKVIIPAATPEDVYNAILSSKEHTEFTGSQASCSGRVGEKFTAWDGYISGKNIELHRNSEIVQEWKTTEWPEGYPPSILKISLKKTRRRHRTQNDSFESSSFKSRNMMRDGTTRIGIR